MEEDSEETTSLFIITYQNGAPIYYQDPIRVLYDLYCYTSQLTDKFQDNLRICQLVGQIEWGCQRGGADREHVAVVTEEAVEVLGISLIRGKKSGGSNEALWATWPYVWLWVAWTSEQEDTNTILALLIILYDRSRRTGGLPPEVFFLIVDKYMKLEIG